MYREYKLIHFIVENGPKLALIDPSLVLDDLSHVQYRMAQLLLQNDLPYVLNNLTCVPNDSFQWAEFSE